MADSLEDKTVEIARSFLAGATPQQKHLYAAFSNYDGNPVLLRALADNPDTDRATALLIYWYAGARSYSYAEDLIQAIEDRYRHDFYSDHGIGFDPYNDELHGAVESWPNEFDLEAVPATMLLAVPGIVPDVPGDLEEGLPLGVALEIEHAALTSIVLSGVPETQHVAVLREKLQRVVETGSGRELENLLQLAVRFPEVCAELPAFAQAARAHEFKLIADIIDEYRGQADDE